MATKFIAFTGLVACWLATPVWADQAPIDPAQGCAKNPAVVGKCFPIKGRVGIYNGSPSVRIRPDGNKRVLGVIPSEQEIMPDELKKAIGLDTDAHAEMTICPFTNREAHKMQLVCVESARNIRPVKKR